MVMTLRRHNPLHLGPAIVWYLWLMISPNRFVVFLWDEYEWRGAWEEGSDLFCFHFVLGSDQRSVSDGAVSALCFAVQTRGGRVFSDWMDFQTEVLHLLSVCVMSDYGRCRAWFSHWVKLSGSRWSSVLHVIPFGFQCWCVLCAAAFFELLLINLKGTCWAFRKILSYTLTRHFIRYTCSTAH